MPKKKMDKRMSSSDLVLHLQSSAEHMMRLAETISEHGRPLTQEEAKLVRMALFGWVEEVLSEMSINFILGRMDSLTDGFSTVEMLTAAVQDIM